jgi:hypothetical protein
MQSILILYIETLVQKSRRQQAHTTTKSEGNRDISEACTSAHATNTHVKSILITVCNYVSTVLYGCTCVEFTANYRIVRRTPYGKSHEQQMS